MFVLIWPLKIEHLSHLGIVVSFVTTSSSWVISFWALTLHSHLIGWWMLISSMPWIMGSHWALHEVSWLLLSWEGVVELMVVWVWSLRIWVNWLEFSDGVSVMEILLGWLWLLLTWESWEWECFLIVEDVVRWAVLVVVDELEWLTVMTWLVWLAAESFDVLWADSPGILLLEVLGIMALRVRRYELADPASTCAKASLGFPISLLSSWLIVAVHLVSS